MSPTRGVTGGWSRASVPACMAGVGIPAWTPFRQELPLGLGLSGGVWAQRGWAAAGVLLKPQATSAPFQSWVWVAPAAREGQGGEWGSPATWL